MFYDSTESSRSHAYNMPYNRALLLVVRRKNAIHHDKSPRLFLDGIPKKKKCIIPNGNIRNRSRKKKNKIQKTGVNRSEK